MQALGATSRNFKLTGVYSLRHTCWTRCAMCCLILFVVALNLNYYDDYYLVTLLNFTGCNFVLKPMTIMI